MGATAEDRVSKRRINDLETKLKKLQRELRAIKVEKKQIGNLRKQAERAAITQAEFTGIVEEELKEKAKKIKEEKDNAKTPHRCRNEECISAGGAYKNTGNCDTIEIVTPDGLRLIVKCRDCGSKYTVKP